MFLSTRLAIGVVVLAALQASGIGHAVLASLERLGSRLHGFLPP